MIRQKAVLHPFARKAAIVVSSCLGVGKSVNLSSIADHGAIWRPRSYLHPKVRTERQTFHNIDEGQHESAALHAPI